MNSLECLTARSLLNYANQVHNGINILKHGWGNRRGVRNVHTVDVLGGLMTPISPRKGPRQTPNAMTCLQQVLDNMTTNEA